jgi:sulfoxide reductase heme-binding subunit YedZ
MTLWYLMRASGLVAFALLTVTVVLGILGALGPRRASSRSRRRGSSRTVTTVVHRNASLLSVVFLAIHVFTAVTDHYVTIPLPAIVVPGVSDYRAFWMALGAVAFDLMVALIVTSLLRVRLGRRTWRAVHWLAYAMWPLALAHSIGTGTDTGRAWTTALYAVCGTVVLAAIAIRTVGRRWWVQSAGTDRRHPPAALDATRPLVAAQTIARPRLIRSPQ